MSNLVRMIQDKRRLADQVIVSRIKQNDCFSVTLKLPKGATRWPVLPYLH